MSSVDDFTDVVNRAIARRHAYNAQVAAMSPQQFSAASSIADTWPQMDPGLVLPLANAGMMGDHPVVQQTAAASAAQKAASGQLAKPGTTTTGQAVKHSSHRGILGTIGHLVASGAGDAYSAGKAATRVGTAALMLPVDLTQGVVRDAVNAVRDPNNNAGTSWLQALQDNIKSTQLGSLIESGISDGDTGGSGFFFNPHSQSGQQQVAAQHRIATINGHSVTLGRELAATVTEPGTRPYNILSGLVDAGVSLGAGNPASKLGKAARGRGVLAGNEAEYVVDAEGRVIPAAQAEAQAAATRDTVNSLGLPENIKGGVSFALGKKGRIERVGADYGLVDGLRKTVLPEKAVTWLNSTAGQRFADFAANSKNFNDIWDSTGRKLPVDVVNQLIDAKDPAQVKQILAGELGTSLRQTPSVSAAQAVAASGGTPGIIGQAGLAVRRARQSPMFTLMPHQSLDLNNPDRAVEDFDRFQRITKAFNADEIASNNEKLSRALTGIGGEGAALQTVLHVTDVVGNAMTKMGMPSDVARRAVRSWRNTVNDLRHFNVDDIGDNVDFPGVLHGGDDMAPAPSPHLFVEYLHNNIPLPNVRDIRTAVSKVHRITDSAPAHLAQDASDFINNNVFKPWALLRGAWPVRVIGEEQARMGAAGYASLVHSPLSYMALLAGSKMPKTAALLQKMGKDALTMDVKGTTWAEQADEALGQDAGEFAQAMSHHAAGYLDPSNGILTRHYPLYTKGIDPGFHVAWTDELRKLNTDPVSRRIAQAVEANTPIPQALDKTAQWLWNGGGASLRNSLAAKWAAAQARRMQPVNNNPFTDRNQLQQWVNSVYQRIDTKTSSHPQLVNAVATGRIMGKNLAKGGDANPDAAAALEGFTDYAPKVVTAPLRVYTKTNSAGARIGSGYKRAVEWGFDHLMSQPTNTLSRSPVFRQAYYQRISELAPYMDAKAAAKAAKNADTASASKAAQALRAGGNGKLTLDDADTIAKKYALDQVSTLLYGESKRSSFFDAFRILFPFGDAWREVVTRWAKLASQNPAVPLRASQIVNGARQSGFTYTDPQTGKETFVYPGSQQLTQLLTGVPVKFTGQASGLNMVSAQMLPGFGPVVQIAAGQLMPNMPQTQGLKDFLMPYGAGDTSGGIFSQLGDTFIPAWLKKFQTASKYATPEQQRELMSTTNQVADYLYSTGKYDISTPDGQQKLLKDARSKATWIWRLRGMAQFGAPAAPEPQISVKDKDGQLHTIYSLGAAYRDIAAKDPNNATADFMAKYGDLALMATNPTTTGTFAPTTSLYDFAQATPGLVKKYPTLYGFFAPAGGAFSSAEYQRQLASGERVGVTPQENLDIANQRMATAVYNSLKAQVAGRTDTAASQWLAAAKDKLAAIYPQFGINATPDQGTIAQQIQRLQIAVKDPQVTGTEAGKGLALYMQARDKALQAAKASGLSSFASAKSAAGIRSWLQGIAAQIEASYPDFSTLYSQVLVHEMSGATS